ncbi:MAG TPA: aspartate 1-decarboxylase [Syntrophales bacterium]|nr:aspartate 1-decarboxylase [Syntrophales bacterium]
MQRTMLKSKLHRVTVTDANLDYEGSITIDETLMDAADLYQFEQVDIYNVSNGERFSTYVIRGPRDSGVICLNGAAARKASKGDIIIIASYVSMAEEKSKCWVPRCVYMRDGNRPRGRKQAGKKK